MPRHKKGTEGAMHGRIPAITRQITEGPWQKPEGMPDDQAERVAAGLECGAPLQVGSNKPPRFCNRKPLSGQAAIGRPVPHRCREHGGSTFAARLAAGEKPPMACHGVTHGIYADAVMPGEEEFWQEIEIDSLDMEIKITKIRLRRALLEERRQRELAELGPKHLATAMEITEETATVGTQGQAVVDMVQVTKKLRNAETMISVIMNQLLRLLQQKMLMTGGGEMTVEEKARMARELMKKMRANLDDPEGTEEKPQ